MKKLLSLIKACMTENMSLFKFKKKNGNKKSGKLIVAFATIMVMGVMWMYANMFMDQLVPLHLEYILLTLFAMVTVFLTLIEGIYKVGNLIFNCKDDDLMFSLPIKKSTVLFVRIFKFYVFEVLYNALFLIPAIIVYVRYVSVGISFFVTVLISLLVLPMIPIALSSIIGIIISAMSSKSRFKNVIQIVLTMAFLVLIFIGASNLQGLLNSFGNNAVNINDTITRLYYPVGLFTKLLTNFNIADLGIFVLIHVAVFIITIFIISKVFFKINSRLKVEKSSKSSGKYKIKASKQHVALIKKEFGKFVSSPVFVINAGFGLVLFLLGAIAFCFKFDSVAASIISSPDAGITIEQVYTYIPVIIFGLLCSTVLMTSLTSSMISLEGRSFNILKSLPVKASKIINCKVLAAVLIMLPFIFVGDLMLFIKFRLSILDTLMIIIASVILPLVTETIGILVNLKFPKMDADNDTEVVKQSASSAVAVFLGMGLIGITLFGGIVAMSMGVAPRIILVAGVIFYTLVYALLELYLKKTSTKKFNAINV